MSDEFDYEAAYCAQRARAMLAEQDYTEALAKAEAAQIELAVVQADLLDAHEALEQERQRNAPAPLAQAGPSTPAGPSSASSTSTPATAPSAASTHGMPTPRVELSCPFGEKEEAKKRGAKYDGYEQVWYVPLGVDLAPFARWIVSERVYLDKNKTYDDRAEILRRGGKYNASKHTWYITPDMDVSLFAKWLPLTPEQHERFSRKRKAAEELRQAVEAKQNTLHNGLDASQLEYAHAAAAAAQEDV